MNSHVCLLYISLEEDLNLSKYFSSKVPHGNNSDEVIA